MWFGSFPIMPGQHSTSLWIKRGRDKVNKSPGWAHCGGGGQRKATNPGKEETTAIGPYSAEGPCRGRPVSKAALLCIQMGSSLGLGLSRARGLPSCKWQKHYHHPPPHKPQNCQSTHTVGYQPYLRTCMQRAGLRLLHCVHADLGPPSKHTHDTYSKAWGHRIVFFFPNENK